MLEEKNDNLPLENSADGNDNPTRNAIEAIEPAVVEQQLDETTNSVIEDVTATTEEEIVAETLVEVAETKNEIGKTADVVFENEVAEETKILDNTVSITSPTDADDAIAAIDESNAEEGEDSTLRERHDIPMKEYATMSLDALVNELEALCATEKVMAIKDHVEEIKKEFLSKYHHFIEEKREEFLQENPDKAADFSYHLPLKTKFDSLYNAFRDKKNAHFKNIQKDLEGNLKKRLAIVQEIKELINPQENIKDVLKHFNELREQWKQAGPIPRDKYNHVWNNYHFHVENFYDYLHLDREARDLDFKHNLEQKQKIIARVKELVEEKDVIKAFRELQDLHKIWKEEIGPVDKAHRESIWKEFSDLTKQIHDKRESLVVEQKEREKENLVKKQTIIQEINLLASQEVSQHSEWQKLIAKIEHLRNDFFGLGKVPSEVNEATWTAFKDAVRAFNHHKNAFYKEIKKDQNDNLTKKLALVEKAKSLQNSSDFEVTTPLMKQIQEEWKNIGHVPRKFSDKLWKEFKDACNAYFDAVKASRNEANQEEMEAFEKKKAYLETVRAFELVGEHKKDLDGIKALIEHWKTLGKVPQNRRHIEGKFNKILDALFEKLSLSKKESEMVRFSNKLEQLANGDDDRKLQNEKIFIRKKIDELQNEIFQLENNIQFFSNNKDAKKENPMVAEVRKNIERHKEELQSWRQKLKQLENLIKE